MILLIEYVPSEEQRSAPFEAMEDVAKQIASIKGLQWKYWLKSVDGYTYGGVYLFATEGNARAGGDALRASLVQAGARDISLRFFNVDEKLSAVTRGIIPSS